MSSQFPLPLSRVSFAIGCPSPNTMTVEGTEGISSGMSGGMTTPGRTTGESDCFPPVSILLVSVSMSLPAPSSSGTGGVICISFSCIRGIRGLSLISPSVIGSSGASFPEGLISFVCFLRASLRDLLDPSSPAGSSCNLFWPDTFRVSVPFRNTQSLLKASATTLSLPLMCLTVKSNS